MLSILYTQQCNIFIAYYSWHLVSWMYHGRTINWKDIISWNRSYPLLTFHIFFTWCFSLIINVRILLTFFQWTVYNIFDWYFFTSAVWLFILCWKVFQFFKSRSKKKRDRLLKHGRMPFDHGTIGHCSIGHVLLNISELDTARLVDRRIGILPICVQYDWTLPNWHTTQMAYFTIRHRTIGHYMISTPHD